MGSRNVDRHAHGAACTADAAARRTAPRHNVSLPILIHRLGKSKLACFVFFCFFLVFFLSFPSVFPVFFFFFRHSVVWKHTRLPDFVLCLGGPRPQIIRARPPPSSTNRRPRRGPANRPRKTRIGDLGAAARRQGRQSREITDHADTKFFCSLFFFSFLFCSSPFLLLHRAAAGSVFVFFFG
jgi:hypothetical protein